MMDVIRSSDLVYYVVPNFCGMLNAVYYSFNECSVGYFNTDRAAMVLYTAVKKTQAELLDFLKKDILL